VTTDKPHTTFSALFQWRSIRTRVTLFTLAIFLVAIWSLEFYASRLLQDDMQHLLGEQQLSAVSFMAASIDEEINERLRAQEEIAKQITPALMAHPSALQSFLEQYPILLILFNSGAFVIGIDGVAIADSPVSARRIGINYADREFIAETLKGKSTVSKPLVGKKLKAPILPIGVPIRDAEGKVIGALVSTINLSKPNFLDKITEHSVGESGGYLLLVDAQHRLVITATDKSRIMETLPAPGMNPGSDSYIQGDERTRVIINPRGVEVLTSAKGILAANWYLRAALPTAIAFAPITAMQQRVMLATIFLTLLAGALTWWMLQHQLAPVFTTIKTLTSLSDADQCPQALPITSRDEIGELIGSLNHLLKNLWQSNAYNRSLIEASLDPLVTIGTDGKISDVNQATQEITGASREELIGSNFSDYFTDPEKANTGYKQVFNDSTVRDYPLVIKHRDGRLIPVLYNASVYLDANGNVAGVFAAARDITERKQAEARINQLQTELEQRVTDRTAQLNLSYQEMESFAYSVSHDLRAPLRSIDGFSLALLEDYADKLDGQGKDYLRRVRSATQRMAQLIDDILKLSRITRCELTLETVNMSNIAVSIVDELRRTSPERTVESVITQGLTTQGDKRLMAVVLENLLGNAWKFTGRKASAHIEFGSLKKDGKTAFFVRDDGAGFDEKYADKLFITFQRLHTEAEFSGTGIGLSLVQHIIQRHGGRVWAEGAVEQGATFWFTLD